MSEQHLGAQPQHRNHGARQANPPRSANEPLTPARLGDTLFRTMTAAGEPFEWDSTVERITAVGLACDGAQRALLLLWDPLHDELEVAVDRAVAGGKRLATGARVALERWADARTVVESRRVRIADESVADPRLDTGDASAPALGGVQALVPLLTHDECLGLVMLALDRRPERLDEAALLEFGRAAGAFIAHARLVERCYVQALAQQALSRVSQVAISIHDQPTVLREIALATLTVMACESCAVEIWNRETDEMETAARAVVAERPDLDRPHGRYPLSGRPSLRFVLDQQMPVQLHAGQIGLAPIEAQMLADDRAESLLLVPLTIAGDSLGQLAFTSSRPRAFDNEAVVFAEEVAAQTALAIQHARFVERTKRQADEQAAMLRVSKAVISGQNLYDTLSQIAKVALGFTGVDGCRILLWHAAADHVEVAAEENAGDWFTYYQPGARYPLADWPSMLQVMTTGMPRVLLVSDPEVSVRERANHRADGVHSIAGVPIMVGDECLGCLALHARQPRRFGHDPVRLAGELAAQAAYAIDRARLFGQLRARAETDGLTGLLNHRAAFETLDQALAAAKADETGVGVIVVDLDDFKLFNDTHGHLIGDRVLVEVARVLKETVRPRDHVARFGGDEFLVILPSATPELAEAIAARLVNRMAQTTVRVDTLNLPIRFSVGAAVFPRDGKSRQELIAYADSSMYSAKELGGGQVGTVQRGTRSLEVSTLGALSGLVRAVDRKDRYTKEHSDLVAEYAVRFARSLRLPPEKVEALDLAGQLHDVGKIAVPDSILRKPGYLSLEEEAMIRQHVVFSELMIKGVPHLDDVLAAVANHHERWDGEGYPNGKMGTQIPLLGRILALADALAAMTADRPYRKGRSLQQAVEEIRAGAGKQFDPDLVGPFIAAVTTGTALLQDSSRRQLNEVAVPMTTGFLRRPRNVTGRGSVDTAAPHDPAGTLGLTVP